jgi:hypothetical protein
LNQLAQIESQLCEAVEIIVDSVISKANFDRTIKATIMSCVDSTVGQYKVKYQDNIFYAYANNISTKYSANTTVYVLIPGNDFSNQKTIIGAVDNVGVDYSSEIEEEQKYEIIGDSCVSAQGEIALKSRYSASYELAAAAIRDFEASQYLTGAKYIRLEAGFRTSLESKQRTQGNYGIRLYLDFCDNSIEKATVTREYTLDINDFSGNPYKLNTATTQYCYFPIEGDNFQKINKIIIFNESFPNQTAKEDAEDDIFISNIGLYAATAFSSDELAGYSLRLETPNGAILSSDDKTSLEIAATARVNGQDIIADADNVSYYWFRENAGIKYLYQGYNIYGGIGWECLNDFETTEMYDNGQVVNIWYPGGNTLTVDAEKAINKTNLFKCVAVYNGNTFSRTVNIYNRDAVNNITIVSDNGFDFYYDQGSPTLTCLLDGEEKNDYRYVWISEDKYGDAVTLDAETAKCQITVNTIVDYAIVKCAVYDEDEKYLGTAQAKIYNKQYTEGQFKLSIVNGSQAFKYDVNGVSPASQSLTNPMTLQPLSFELYDTSRGLISANDILDSQITWYIPFEDTLLKYTGTSTIDNGNYVITGAREINYDIASSYNYTYSNN